MRPGPLLSPTAAGVIAVALVLLAASPGWLPLLTG
jgi:hypothetical protein